MVWQQYGPPSHFGCTGCAFLNEKFRVWIGGCRSAAWPPVSPDLTPNWGITNNEMYSKKPAYIFLINEQMHVEYNNSNVDNNFVQKVVN